MGKSTTIKMIRTLTIGLLVPALWALGGCLEIAVKTKISGDGSSERTVSVKLPAKTLPAHAYPVATGPGWTSEWRETGEKDLPYEFVGRKHFSTPEELSAEYSRGPDTGAVRISVSVERSFEWFHTSIDYRETYSLANPFVILPVRTQFSSEEIRRIGMGEKSDSLNKKVEEWDYRNTFEEFYARLTRAIGEGDAGVNALRLEAVKEEVFRLSREDTAHSTGDPAQRMVGLFEKALRSKAIDRYRDAVTRARAEVDSMLERRKSADRWISSVMMPGAIVTANGETVGDGEVRWQIESKQLLVTSVFLGARSRVTNAWAFAATGALALILLVPAVFGFLRRRTRR
jgi:hypothetical protein